MVQRNGEIDGTPESEIDSRVGKADLARPLLSGSGYKKLRRNVAAAIALVALVPLIILTVINYRQYEDSLQSEMVQSTSRLLANNKQSLEFFLAERRSALGYLVRERSFSELCDADILGRIVRNMNDSFAHGMFVDLEVFNSQGVPLCHYGPHDLTGVNYSHQEWFQQVVRKKALTSDVFLGRRKSPHFAIATLQALPAGDFYVLRATFDADVLNDQIHRSGIGSDSDIFLVNGQGVLQTPSGRYGNVLEAISLDIPNDAEEATVDLVNDERQKPIMRGCAAIADSPFILMSIGASRYSAEGVSVLTQLTVFFLISGVLVLAVILWGTHQFFRHLREENLRRAALMRKVEYQNKLASIGRLAAGVAHEVNNPLAIINEKTGLMKDILGLEDEFPHRQKFLSIVGSVLDSVMRCRKITHRLLGFAKHMDTQREVVHIPNLVNSVLGFLEKEIDFRSIHIDVKSDDDIPEIESDGGQLQQVFLNLINNAMNAVKDGGHIGVDITRSDSKWISIVVSDDGIGISKENTQRVFEPFFTTKQDGGTGLGLSITYGIVQKLKGKILVESELGQGTRFTVRLPIKRKE